MIVVGEEMMTLVWSFQVESSARLDSILYDLASPPIQDSSSNLESLRRDVASNRLVHLSIAHGEVVCPEWWLMHVSMGSTTVKC